METKELVEKCMPTLERFEIIEKQVFFPIPKPVEFSTTIRIYAATMSREAIRKAIPIIKQAGIREVVEWIHSITAGAIIEVDDTISELPVHVERRVWKAKLREWGVDKPKK